MVRMIISVSRPIKVKLDALRAQGITASGLIRRLLNEFFDKDKPAERRTPR